MPASPSYALLMNPGQTSNTAGTPYASSTSITDVSGGANVAGEAFTIPANFMQTGQVWRWTAAGIYSTTGTPNLTLGVYLGGVAGTALAAAIAVTTPSSVTNVAWFLQAISRVTATGTSGTVLTQGFLLGVEATSAITTSAGVTMLADSGGSSTQNTSVANIVTVGATWSASSSSNTLTCEHFLAELLTP
jgi:hypothetical protein